MRERKREYVELLLEPTGTKQNVYGCEENQVTEVG